jgi:hypothetical protein
LLLEEIKRFNLSMTLISDLHQQWSNDPEYQAAYEAQRPEFEIASAIITAHSSANLTQKELAELMSRRVSGNRAENPAKNCTS